MIHEAKSAPSSPAETILCDSGISALPKGATARTAEPCLRKLAGLLIDVDALTLAVVCTEAVALLKSAGIAEAKTLITTAVEGLAARTNGDGSDQGTELVLPDPEPWPDPVNIAEVLDQLVAVHSRYVALPEGAAVAAALWDAHTYAIDAAQVSPFLEHTSPVKRCGKSTATDLHQPSRAGRSSLG